MADNIETVGPFPGNVTYQLTVSDVSSCNETPPFPLPSSSAVDSRTAAKVAIKKLYRPFQSELFAKRAYRELRLLKHMKHENVGKLKQVRCDDDYISAL